jgi:glycosyltransferase involved in cell wall biosynthesis
MAPRRFAIVAPNFHPRVCGIGDFSARMAAELMRRGHEVAVFSRLPVSPHPFAPEVEAHGLKGRWPSTIARRAGASLEAFRPTDVLLQFSPQMWGSSRFGSAALPWLVTQARRRGARAVLIAHEPFIPLGRRPDLLVGAVLQRLQMAALVKACDRVFVTTGNRAEMLLQISRLVGAPAPGVIRVGANALPLPRARARDAARPRLGIFSTAAVGKRFDVVLEAFAGIGREVPGAELVLIGDLGDPGLPLVRAVADSIARHPARERIRVTGRLSLAEVSAEIAELDLYLFPMSTGANTRSGTLPAALGSGLPIVAVRGAETDDELFRDGDNVVFAQALTGGAFADAALRLIRDPALMERVTSGALRLYAEHLSWERIVDRFLAELG